MALHKNMHTQREFKRQCKYYKKVLIKRYVFSCFLKSSIEELHLIFSGSLFHNLGPATLNDLSANVLRFINGIASMFREADLVLYATLCGDKRFDK